MVVKGFSQREGFNYKDIFSPVVKHSSIRILMTLVATAFLHGNMKDEIYMKFLNGMDVTNAD